MIYEGELPSDFKPLFEVAGCYMEHNGEVLFLHRNNDKSEGAKWGVPGGKRDVGETLEQALAREILQETGVQIKETDLVYHKQIFVRHARHDIIYHIFRLPMTAKPSVTLNDQEHQAYAWATPQAALTMELVTDVDGCIASLYGAG